MARIVFSALLAVVVFVHRCTAHSSHDQAPIAGPHKSLWYNTLPGDGGTQVGRCEGTSGEAMGSISLTIVDFQADSVFSGISTFGRLPYFPCLASDEVEYDIAFIGGSSFLSLLWPRRCDAV